MNRVEPIRDRRKISAIKNLTKGGKRWRDYALFVLGINFGLRIDDLLNLKIKDVVDESGEIIVSSIRSALRWAFKTSQ